MTDRNRIGNSNHGLTKPTKNRIPIAVKAIYKKRGNGD